MIVYLIKSALCLLVLLAFYKVALENQKMHTFKRYYLLASLLLSLALPLITFTYETEALNTVTSNLVYQTSSQVENVNSGDLNVKPKEYVLYSLLGIYLAGVVILGFRFLRNLFQLKNKIGLNKKVPAAYYINVLLEERTAPYSFLKFIFLNQKDFEEDKIAPEIMQHELAHVMQKHSWDIILLELLRVFFWFNPLLSFYKNAISTNHEFLADESVISKTHQISAYSWLLIMHSSGSHHPGLSSAFNNSLIKKRIVMITKSNSTKRMAARISLLVPVLALCLFLFNNNIVAKPSVENEIFLKEAIPLMEEEKFAAGNVQQKQKSISIMVDSGKIMLNGEAVDLENFSEKLNELTAEWTEEEIKKANLNIAISNAEDDDFLQKLNEAYRATRFAKLKDADLLPPAPPAPPKINRQFPTSPAPPKTPARQETKVPEPPSPDSVFLAKGLRQHMSERMAKLFFKTSRSKNKLEALEQRRLLSREKRNRLQEKEERTRERREKTLQRREEILEDIKERKDSFMLMERRRQFLDKIREDTIRRKELDRSGTGKIQSFIHSENNEAISFNFPADSRSKILDYYK